MKILSGEQFDRICAWNKERKTFYRQRAAAALADEGREQRMDLIEGLADMAWQLEAGGLPSLEPLLRRGHRAVHNKVHDDAQRISKAANRLSNAINECAVVTELELIEKLERKGFTANAINSALNALAEVASEMASIPKAITKQGNTPSPKSAWFLAVWPLLENAGFDIPTAGVLLSKVVYGDSAQGETIYQAIRNSTVR